MHRWRRRSRAWTSVVSCSDCRRPRPREPGRRHRAFLRVSGGSRASAGRHTDARRLDGRDRLAAALRVPFLRTRRGKVNLGQRAPRRPRWYARALTAGSKSTLWGRLSAHKGSTKTGGGSHPASIFRLLAGVALWRSAGQPVPPSWGLGGHPGIAATKLGITSQEVLAQEHPLEVRVTYYIGAMPFLWLAVDDPPWPASSRGVIECNRIALLSNAVPPTVNEPSQLWLWRLSHRQAVRESGLWNIRCVRRTYIATGLDVLEAWVGRVRERARRAP